MDNTTHMNFVHCPRILPPASIAPRNEGMVKEAERPRSGSQRSGGWRKVLWIWRFVNLRLTSHICSPDEDTTARKSARAKEICWGLKVTLRPIQMT